MSWSNQQQQAIDAVRAFMSDRSRQVFYLAGYAGTGKTTLAKHLASGVNGRVLYGAFTGKAALVLRNKGCYGASTIHSMIYKLSEHAKGWEPEFELNFDSDVNGAGLVVIDECSMVDETLGNDLLSFEAKVLVLGDPAQLPPVKGTGYFTSQEPDFMLTEVHRQAIGNPIIKMSMQVRKGERLEYGTYGESEVIQQITNENLLAADQVIVGKNKTRQIFNSRIRKLKGYSANGPQVGDKLICLRNNRDKKLFNGGMFEVVEMIEKNAQTVTMLVTSEDHIESLPTKVQVPNGFFQGLEGELPWEQRSRYDEFTYGYAITCHKSQGSQWSNVLVLDEASSFRQEANKWRYTALTRAADKLTWVQ